MFLNILNTVCEHWNDSKTFFTNDIFQFDKYFSSLLNKNTCVRGAPNITPMLLDSNSNQLVLVRYWLMFLNTNRKISYDPEILLKKWNTIFLRKTENYFSIFRTLDIGSKKIHTYIFFLYHNNTEEIWKLNC